MIYLDWAATAAPQKDIIRESLETSLQLYGNPSSLHNVGLKSANKLEECRIECARLLNCNREQMYFTSGGSESNNIVLLSFLKKHFVGEIISTTIEHPSISEPIMGLKNFGWKSKLIPPTENGLLNIKKLIKSITEKTKIISLIYVHNETGVIQPLETIVTSIREKEKVFGKKIHIHIDGVQSVGKVSIDLNSLNIDSFSVSGHKFGAPKGSGLLYLKEKKDVLCRGGGQESGVRAGTQDLFGIISLTNCLKYSLDYFEDTHLKLNQLMNKLIEGVRNIGVSTIPKNRQINDPNFVPNILSLTYPPLPGEVIARVLNKKGFMISTGSACSNNKKSNTKGILSMGITEDEGFSSFRISVGEFTTLKDIELLLKALEESLKELAP